MPISQPPSRRAPGRASRSCQRTGGRRRAGTPPGAGSTTACRSPGRWPARCGSAARPGRCRAVRPARRGRLQPEHARGLTGCPHPGGNRHVQRGQPVRGSPARGVHHPGGDAGLLGELLDLRGLLDHVDGDRGEPTAVIGRELHLLGGGRAVPGQEEHLLAGQGQLHRAAGQRPGRHRREDDVRVRVALRPETAAHEGADHPYPLLVQPEDLGHGRPGRVHPLGGVPQGQRDVGARLPQRSGGVRLERVVVVHRRGVGAVEGDRTRRHRCGEVARGGVGLERGIDLVRLVQVAGVRAQLGVVRLPGVGNPDQFGAMPGCFRGLGDDEPDRLAAEGDLGRLQHGQLAVVGSGQPLGVLSREHGQDPGEPFGGGGAEAGHPSPGDGGPHDKGVRGALDRGLVGVRGGAAHLALPVAAGEIFTHGMGFKQTGHVRPPGRAGARWPR